MAIFLFQPFDSTLFEFIRTSELIGSSELIRSLTNQCTKIYLCLLCYLDEDKWSLCRTIPLKLNTVLDLKKQHQYRKISPRVENYFTWLKERVEEHPIWLWMSVLSKWTDMSRIIICVFTNISTWRGCNTRSFF